MTIAKAKENQSMVNDLFTTFIEIVSPYLIDQSQLEVLQDAKWSVSGCFDAEISYAINCKKFENGL